MVRAVQRGEERALGGDDGVGAEVGGDAGAVEEGDEGGLRAGEDEAAAFGVEGVAVAAQRLEDGGGRMSGVLRRASTRTARRAPTTVGRWVRRVGSSAKKLVPS